MDLRDDKVIGIVGGMGPKAGAALLDSILAQTHAKTDQEHLSVILMSFPRYLVDRTAFLDGATPCNPAYNICKVIRKLEMAGASLIGIACNASHASDIYDVITEELAAAGSRVKLVHMPLETCRYIRNNYPGVQRIGVLSTNGTYHSRVYPRILRDLDLDAIIPDEHFQREVIHKMIYDPLIGIKANSAGITQEAFRLWEMALQYFRDRKAEAIILGCTELSLIPPGEATAGMLLADSTNILAAALIREAVGLPKCDDLLINNRPYA